MEQPTYPQINQFINSLDEAQRDYCANCLSFASRVRQVLKEYNFTDKKIFCEKVGVTEGEYDAFVSGGLNYSLKEISKFEAFYSELILEKKKQKVGPETKFITFPPYKYSEEGLVQNEDKK